MSEKHEEEPEGVCVVIAKTDIALLSAICLHCASVIQLVVMLALLLPPYRRHQLVAGGSIIVQGIALAMLSTLFAEGSSYYRMSSLAHMGQALPAFRTARQYGASKIAVD